MLHTAAGALNRDSNFRHSWYNLGVGNEVLRSCQEPVRMYNEKRVPAPAEPRQVRDTEKTSQSNLKCRRSVTKPIKGCQDKKLNVRSSRWWSEVIEQFIAWFGEATRTSPSFRGT